MLHWGWFVLLLQTLGLGLDFEIDTNDLINITALTAAFGVQNHASVDTKPTHIGFHIIIN